MLTPSPRSRRHACLVAALAGLPLWTIAQPHAPCGGEPLPAHHARQKLLCAVDFGITPGSGDVTQQLSDVLNAHGHEKAHLFLPAGDYGIRIRLDLPAGTGLIGSTAGKTRLTTYSDPSLLSTFTSTLGLGGHPDSPDETLVENLHLDNVRIVVSPGGQVAIRRNLLRGIKTPQQQLVLEGSGERIVEDNVFWRESSTRAGAGIEVFTESGMASNGNTTIRNNLIGAVDLDKLRPGQAESAARLARDAMGALAPAGLGHYTTAIQLIGSDNIRLEGNVIASPETFQLPERPGQPEPLRRRFHPLATFVAANNLSLIGNTFHGGPNKVVTLASVSDADVRQNIFFNARLRINTFEGLPTKRTVVQDNWFKSKGVKVNIAVNGSGNDHTSPDDLLIAGNIVTAPGWNVPSWAGCGYVLRPPAVGTRNFTVEPGRQLTFMAIDVKGEPQPLCER